MRGDSALLLSCLDMQQAFKDVLIPMEAQHRNLQAESNRLQTELTQVRIDIQALPSGIYFVESLGKAGKRLSKLVVH